MKHRVGRACVVVSLAVLGGACGAEFVASQSAPQEVPVYRRYPTPGASALLALSRELGPGGMRLVYMINRRDIEHILAGDTLVVPEQVGDPLDFAPFPRVVPGAEGESKLILVSLRVQALGAYEAGRLVYWAPASTGRREKPTPPGRYHVNWTSRERISSVNGEWLLRWVVNIHNTSGISTHQYALPGYPASHSCVRLMEEDARWVHDWVDMWVVNSDETEVVKPGTPLIVFGEWIWDARDPWRNLPDDRGACTISAEEINAALALPPPPEDAFEIDPLPEDAGQ